MRIGKSGLVLIKSFEGFEPIPYICPAGKNTVGYGHVILGSDRFVYPLTEMQASFILAQDMETRFEPKLNDMLDVDLTQNEFDALCSFIYNLGPTALAGSTLMAKINEGDTDAAADQFLRWNHIGGQVSEGLTRRRLAERALFMKEGSV